MAVILGNDAYRYELQEGWGKLPDGWDYKEASSVAVDRKDNVYVFSRGEHPMIVFDRDGNFLRSWGEGRFKRPHGLHMGPDDTAWPRYSKEPRPKNIRSLQKLKRLPA